MSPEQILDAILAHPDPNSDRVGFLANSLLSEYHRGYPIENLRSLLRSADERSLDTGIFIASELGPKGKPLLNDVAPLVAHPRKRVRFQAIDCILLWAGPSDSAELASAIALLGDAEPGVRWKAMDFLSRASREQLEAALAHFQTTEPSSEHVRGLRWLLGPDASDPAKVIAIVGTEDIVLRKYGAVAAARMSKHNTVPLFSASKAEDSDVKGFADSYIRLL